MSSDRNTEQQLRAFGTTLRHGTDEPIVPNGAGTSRGGEAPVRRRRWALLGAAACVLALVAGLLVVNRGDDAERGRSDIPAQADAALAAPFAVPDDAIGLAGDRWSSTERDEYVFGMIDAIGCAELRRLESMGGRWVVQDLYHDITDELPFVEVSYLRAASGAAALAAAAAMTDLSDCDPPEDAAVEPLTFTSPFPSVSIAGHLGPPATIVVTDSTGRMVVMRLGNIDDLGTLDALATSAAAYLAAAPPWEPVDAAPASSMGGDPAVTSVPYTGAITAPPTTADADGLSGRVAPDALELAAAGWTFTDRATGWLIFEPAIDDVVACDAYGDLAGLMDVPIVRDAYSRPTGEVLSVTYVELGREGTADALRRGIGSLDGCPEPGGILAGDGALVRFEATDLGATGWSVRGTHAVVAVVDPGRPLDVGVVIAVSGSDPSTIDLTIDTVVAAASRFVGLPSQPTPIAPRLNVTEGLDPELTGDALVLMVSNQSFEDDPVGLRISIDGELVVDDRFEVGSQHNVSYYVVRGLSTGPHDVAATSDTGVSFLATVTTAPGRPRWAYLTYWYYPGDPQGRFVDVVESDEAILID